MMDPCVQSLLTRMSLCVEPAEVEALRPQLLEAIDARLAELAQDDHRLCLLCSYSLTLGAEDICLCCSGECPCQGQWPPYNESFRCEGQARLAWLGQQSALYQARPSQRPFKARRFPGDPAPPPPAPDANAGLFEQLRQVDLSEYAGKFTRLTQVETDRWLGKCPMHEEKTGSFYVFRGERGWRWHCFGACAQGGDIVALERELEALGKA